MPSHALLFSNQKLNYCQLCLPAECLERILNAIISINLSHASFHHRGLHNTSIEQSNAIQK